MRREHWKLVVVFVAVAIVATIFALLFPGTRSGPPAAARPLPNPNGYDTFLKAAGLLNGDVANALKLGPPNLRVFVEGNSNALALMRTGLLQECRVPLQFSQRYAMLHSSDVVKFRYLTLALIIEGRLAETEQHAELAAKSYLDAVHLGTETGRGGVAIDGLVGISNERMGTVALEPLIGRLDANACRNVATNLEFFDAQRSPWNDTLDQERLWIRNSSQSIREQLAMLLPQFTSMRKSAEAATTKRFNENIARTRRDMIAAAARAYELEKGHRPATLADLVPDYLKAIPQDPITGTNMTYAP